MGDTTVTETLATSRKTGWFPFKDLDKTAVVRRLNAVYDSSDDLTVKIYADGDSVNPTWTGTMPKNGVTGATLSSSATNSDTTLDVTSTTKITSLDKILVDREIMSVQDLITNGTFDANSDSWDGDDSWSNGQLVVTSNGSANARSTQGFTTVVGKVYRVTGDFIKGTANQGQVHIGDEAYFDGNYRYGSAQFTSSQSFDFTFTATETTHYILLHDASAQDSGDTTIWDNISIICTTQLKVTRGQVNTQAQSHTSGTTVYFGHRKWDSKRIGRRAKYMSVEVSTIASTTATEISKMEIEYE
jgi:hypothetical protein